MESLLFFIKKLHHYSGKTLYINMIGMMVISMLEGIGIILVIPLVNLVEFGGLSDLKIDFLNSDAVKNVISYLNLPVMLGIYTLLVILQSYIQRSLAIRNLRIHMGFINRLRLATYRSLLNANWDFFLLKRKTDLINSLTDELGRLSAGTAVFLQLATSLIFTFIQILIALWISPLITIFVLFCGQLLGLSSRIFIKKSQAIGKKQTKITKDYIRGLTEDFNGIKEIKTNNLETIKINWLKTWNTRVEEEKLSQRKLTTLSQLIYKSTFAIIIAFVIYFSIRVFDTQLEQLLLIMLIFTRLWPRFSNIQGSLEQLAANLPAIQSIRELQQEASRYFEEEEAIPQKTLTIKRELSCERVFYQYNQKGETDFALRNITLKIPINSMVAIVGPSGAGKSTLVDIIMGLIKPTKGKVFSDGEVLTDSEVRLLRNMISYVPQDPFLFHTSIRENLLLINPDATEAELWEALKFAEAADFVQTLPESLDTVIGDRGIKLSGGERQRLVLARAILKKPSILVLDEATSSLDSENEAKIQSALEQLKGKVTIIVIAHRLSTIRNADKVIVLDKGEIIQQGGFKQLANEDKGVFNSLLKKQTEAV
ncbi:ABC transporter ATP-binding protein [Mesobacillus sp.]|uniref:ABC transporter ATP-binding protein n=1 Tax=Mesobacillus sp. TaxID=2675271 RepID=UPI0039EF8FD2